MVRSSFQPPRLPQKQSPVTVPGFVAFVLPRNSAGFTLVELIVVIIIAGILAAVALPRWGGKTGFEERALRDETMSALRYAHKSAVAARRTVCAEFTASSVSFKIATLAGATDCTTSNPLFSPQGDAALVVTAKDSRFDNPPASLNFDAAGRMTSPTATIKIIDLDGLPITVEQETGYVH